MGKIDYIPLEETVKELRNRQTKKIGWDRVREIIGPKCPLSYGPSGYLWRHVATGRWEDIQFLQRCREYGIEPIWGTLIEDKFLTRNPSKTRIGQVKWKERVGKNHTLVLRKVWVIDPIASEGLPFSKIKTKWGEPLTEFHKRFRETISLPTNGSRIIDFSEWMQSFGKASAYYFPLMAFMTIGGIYFESFETIGSDKGPQRNLKKFKKEIVIPAIEKVEETLGIEPLIVEHPMPGQEEKTVLEEYPPLMGKFLKKLEWTPLNNKGDINQS